MTAVLVCSSLYLLYYLVFVVNKPRLYGGGAKLKPHLLAHCPTLQKYYWPTVWALNCHVNTLSRFVLQKDIDIRYSRYPTTCIHVCLYMCVHMHESNVCGECVSVFCSPHHTCNTILSLIGHSSPCLMEGRWVWTGGEGEGT